MNLCVIPARGGSKRIPRKNIRDFCGKPMIAWSIEAAIKSGLFQHIVVSTDDDEIAEVAEAYGAEVPFRRPIELSDDHTGTTPVIAHALNWALEAGRSVDAVCCLYATAPFVTLTDMRVGLERLSSRNWSFCFTATTFASPIFRSFREAEDGGVEMFFPNHFDTRSQDLPQGLHDAGQFYWGTPEAWISGKRIFERHSSPLIIPRWRVQDIDNLDDWSRAEILWRMLNANKTNCLKCTEEEA